MSPPQTSRDCSSLKSDPNEHFNDLNILLIYSFIRCYLQNKINDDNHKFSEIYRVYKSLKSGTSGEICRVFKYSHQILNSVIEQSIKPPSTPPPPPPKQTNKTKIYKQLPVVSAWSSKIQYEQPDLPELQHIFSKTQVRSKRREKFFERGFPDRESCHPSLHCHFLLIRDWKTATFFFFLKYKISNVLLAPICLCWVMGLWQSCKLSDHHNHHLIVMIHLNPWSPDKRYG